MLCKTLRLPITAIDVTRREYQITTRPCTDDLVASVEALGLLNPPLLKAFDHGYAIVCGFRRVEACRRLSLPEFESRVVDGAVDPLFHAQAAIADNSFQRDLNLIEQSRALKLLSATVQNYECLRETAARLGLPANRQMIEKIMMLADMSPQVQKMILEGTLSLGMVDEFNRLQDDDAPAVAALFDRLQPSLMKQRELLDALREIALRDRIRIEDLIQSPDILVVMESDDHDRNEKTRLIRDMLKRRRFPAISSAEDRLERVWRATTPGNNVSLKPPPYFEGDTFSMTLQFRNADELRKHRDLLDRMIGSAEFATFFKQPGEKSR